MLKFNLECFLLFLTHTSQRSSHLPEEGFLSLPAFQSVEPFVCLATLHSLVSITQGALASPPVEEPFQNKLNVLFVFSTQHLAFSRWKKLSPNLL